MNTQSPPSRLNLLQEIYALYDSFAQGQNIACTKSCAACCTSNVVLTSLEAGLLLNQLLEETPNHWHQTVSQAAQKSRFQPCMTINQLADLCAQDEPLPQEDIPADPGPCPLLKNNVCTVYAARPLACRSMVSTKVCAARGIAEMPEFVLTVNNVFQQFVEAADSQGVSGNLADVLLHLYEVSGGKPEPMDPVDLKRKVSRYAQGLVPNRSLSVLMIPPEHRPAMEPLLEKIRSIFSAWSFANKPAK